MSRLISVFASSLLLALAMGTSWSALAQSTTKATSDDTFWYRGTGGVPPR
jgi:hypothetical protein